MDSPSNVQANSMTNSMAKRAALYIGILAFALVILLFLGAGQASAEDVSGDITDDIAVWASGGVYNLTGTVNIYGNLTIEDNVTVVAQGYYWINVMDGGSLTVLGTEALGVTFNNESGVWWGGIEFWDGSSGSIEYASIYNCYYGVYIENVTDITLSNLEISTVNYGISGYYYGPGAVALTLTNITIMDTSDYALEFIMEDGDMDLTLQGIVTEDTYAIAYIDVYDAAGNGTLDLTLAGCSFNNTNYGFIAYADIIGDVSVTGSSFTNSYADYSYVLYLEASHGDMLIDFEDVIIENTGGGLYAYTDGNITANFLRYVVNDTTYASDLYAYGAENAGFMRMTYVDCEFSNMYDAVYTYSDMVPTTIITNTVFSYVDDPVDIYAETGLVSVSLTNVTIENSLTGIRIDADYEAIDIVIVADGLSISYCDGYAIDAYPEYGGNITLDLNDLNITTSDGINASTPDGWIDIQLTNSMFGEISNNVLTIDSFQDMTVELQNVSAVDVVSGVLDASSANGSADITIEGLITDFTEFIGMINVQDYFGTGTVTLAISDSWFNDTSAGIEVLADRIDPVTMVDTVISNIVGDISAALMEAPTISLPTVPVGLLLLPISGDLEVTLENVVFENVIAGLVAPVFDGNATLTMTEVISNNTMGVAMVLAADDYNTGTIDATITDCSFNNTYIGVMLQADLIGTVTVTNTFVAGTYVPETLQTGYGFGIYASEEGPLTTLVFDHVTAEDIGYVFDVEVHNDLSLTIDSAVTNDTGIVGYFEALNLGQDATMDIVVVDSSFSNTTTGLVFITNILEPDFSLLGTNTFTNIFGQSLILEADLGDVVMNFEQFVMTNGGGISVFLGIGNIEVNIIDSMMDCSGYGTIFDLEVGSNTIDNGFITIYVENSILSDAEFGIFARSEELNPVNMVDSQFVNITGEAMNFDVRTNDVIIDLTNVSVLNSGAGLVVYANEGDLLLNMQAVHFDIAQNEGYGYGAWLEVSSLSFADLSVMDITVNASLFEGGYNGIYAIALNGGNVLIQDSEFLGQSDEAFTFNSLYGEVNVDVLGSVFDGSSAEDSVTLYTVEQVDYEFLLYGRTGAWNGTYAYDGGVDVMLPFAFEYNGVEYTEVTFHEDGYLKFGSGNRIRPVGDVELGYENDHFYGYKVADDLSYVLFNWYAYNDDVGTGESNSFQVILYANGEIRFNYAYMDNWYGDNNFWGLRTDGGYGVDYNMYDLIGLSSWQMDLTSWVFTPHDMSEGSAMSIVSDFGDMNVVIDNTVITSYFAGGVLALAWDGEMNFLFTDNTVSYMHTYEDSDAMGAIEVANFEGNMTFVMEGNSFERIWCPAAFATVLTTFGGSHTFEVNDNEFTKVYYGVFTMVECDNYLGYNTNGSLTVVANFNNNLMTDAFGLGSVVDLYSYNDMNWAVSVEQTFANNVMEQAIYEGSFPTMDFYYYPSGGIVAEVYIDTIDMAVTNFDVEQAVIITDNVLMMPVEIDSVYISNTIENIMGDVDTVLAITITGNEITVIDSDAIDIETGLFVDLGTIATDTRIIVQNNQITDGYLDSTGVEISMYVYSGEEEYWDSEYEMATDLTAALDISVTENQMEGLDEGIDVYVEFWQDNTVGTWDVVANIHLDDNEIINSTYAVDAYLGGGSWFTNNYWPYYDEVAVATFNMDYVLTVDNNLIFSIGGDEDDMSDAIIYVEVDAWAEVAPSTHFTEAYANVNGAVSVSGNDITQEDGDLVMLFLENRYSVVKTGFLDLAVDIAVDNNVYELIYTEFYDLWWYADYIMVLQDDAQLDGNYDIPTDEPTAVADISWSVTGNQLIGWTEFGIAFMQIVDVESPSCNLLQNLAVDISGNTVDGASEGGIGYMLERWNGNYFGSSELNIDLAIENNIITMAEEDDMSGLVLSKGYERSGMFVGAINDYYRIVQMYERNETVSINVAISGNAITGATVGMSLGQSYDEEEGILQPEESNVFNVEMLVDGNTISDSTVGIAANGGNMSISNNHIEAFEIGIDWENANGDVSANIIIAPMGIVLDYPNEVTVIGNQVYYLFDGIYVSDHGSGHDWTFDPAVLISGNTLTFDDTLVPMGYLNMVGGGVVLKGVGNVVVEDNIIGDGNYGIYVDGAYNLTVSGNTLLNSYLDGIYLYYVYLGWIESNVVMYSGEFGVLAYGGCWYLTIGNNTIADNAGIGLNVSSDNWSTVIYNNEITGNGMGMDVDYAMWIVDAAAKVARNGVEFEGSIEIRSGGSLVIQDVPYFEYDGDELLVTEGGLLSASNSNFFGETRMEVFGTLWSNLCLFEGYDIYLGPSSEAEIRGGAIMWYEWAGVHVDGCAPVIADNLIFSPFGMYGILVEGEGAAPSIVSNIIALNDFGVYGRGTDMGGIYDNLIVLNMKAGILAEDAVGKIHDNILLANKVEILLRNSDVTVEDNEIGYTDLFQVLANYAPLLSHFMSSGESDLTISSEDPVASLESVLGVSGLEYVEIVTWIKAHNGIWAENSVVRTSGNQYGLLNYALYAVDSEIHFADDVRNIVLNVPHANGGEMYNYSLTLYTMNGLYAARSQVWVDGSTIEVLDDALVFESSEAWVEGATLLAGDFDYFVFGGSDVYNIATTYAKYKVMDSHSLNEGTWLTITFLDEGDPAVNISVLIKNAKGETVYNGTTDAEGKVRILLTQYSYTSEGKDDGFNPYTITADFESGEKSVDVTLDQSYQDLTIEGEEESDMGAILAVVGVLVIILLIVAAVVVMRRRK